MKETKNVRGWMMATARNASGNDSTFTMGNIIRRDPRWKNAVEVVGPYDLVIQVTGESLDDLYGQLKELSELDSVGSITTYIVMSSCDIRKGQKSVSHIIIDTRPRDMEKVWHQLQSLPQIIQVDVTLGAVDIIAVTDVPFEGLGDLLTEIRKINGVLRTVTMLSLEPSAPAAL